MTRPTARVLTLLEVLQSGGTRNAAEIAGRLGVDERTVRRYVEHLRDLDIPVEAVRGRYGGYRLARHARMPPLMLNDDEALAVIWGLLALGRSDTGPVSPVDVDTATSKVRRVLPPTLSRRIDAVLRTVEFTADRTPEPSRRSGPGVPTRVLTDLTRAIADRRPVSLRYAPRHGRPRESLVRPYGVVSHEGRLYLTGFDEAADQTGTFRLDRITGLQLLDGTFDAPADEDTLAPVLGPLAAAPSRHDVSVLIRADVRHVRRFIPETLATVTPVVNEEAEQGWLRVFLRAERLEWVAGRLAVLDRPFVVEEPDALLHALAALGRRLVDAGSRST